MAHRNFFDLPLVAVATYTVGLAFVAGALASDDTDPFDVFVASFASNSRQNRRHRMMAHGMSKRKLKQNRTKKKINGMKQKVSVGFVF